MSKESHSVIEYVADQSETLPMAYVLKWLVDARKPLLDILGPEVSINSKQI